MNKPPQIPPENLLNSYTMDSKIPLWILYADNSNGNKKLWTDDLVKQFINKLTVENIKAKNLVKKDSPYGPSVVVDLLESFEKYNIKNMNVAVVGSITPWIESILLNLNNTVTTIEYGVDTEKEYLNGRLKYKDYFNYFEKNQNSFDCVVTFSSIEHSGLGRYGDPLDPNGDLKTMECIYNNLKKNGKLIWGAPVGKDAVVWNVHRIYGKIRLPLLFKNFKELEWIRYNKTDCINGICKTKNSNGNEGVFDQPVVVLEKN